MAKQKTSFGTREVVSKEPLVERMVFEKQGRSHQHAHEDEHCFVLRGSGVVVGADKRDVTAGDFCSVPAGTHHYMIPYEAPFELLIFYSTV